jgi:hypothetical protein
MATISWSLGEQSRAQIEAFDDTWHWGDEAGRTTVLKTYRAIRAVETTGQQSKTSTVNFAVDGQM